MATYVASWTGVTLTGYASGGHDVFGPLLLLLSAAVAHRNTIRQRELRAYNIARRRIRAEMASIARQASPTWKTKVNYRLTFGRNADGSVEFELGEPRRPWQEAETLGPLVEQAESAANGIISAVEAEFGQGRGLSYGSRVGYRGRR